MNVQLTYFPKNIHQNFMAQIHDIGQTGENLAAHYLSAKGYSMLGAHVRVGHKELDLVCRDPNGVLVFVEVKTRTSSSFGEALDAVDPHKLARLLMAAKIYRFSESERGQWRIDVVAITLSQNFSLVEINHVEDVTL